MRKHSQHNNDERNTVLLKNIPLTLYSKWLRKGYERLICERWVGDWTNCNILTPSSFVFSSTSFSFCWLLNRGSWGPIALCWGLVLTTASYAQLTDSYKLNFLSHRVISLFDVHLLPVSVAFAPNSTRQRSRVYLDVFDRMHLFLDWRLGRRSICYMFI